MKVFTYLTLINNDVIRLQNALFFITVIIINLINQFYCFKLCLENIFRMTLI